MRINKILKFGEGENLVRMGYSFPKTNEVQIVGYPVLVDILDFKNNYNIRALPIEVELVEELNTHEYAAVREWFLEKNVDGGVYLGEGKANCEIDFFRTLNDEKLFLKITNSLDTLIKFEQAYLESEDRRRPRGYESIVGRVLNHLALKKNYLHLHGGCVYKPEEKKIILILSPEHGVGKTSTVLAFLAHGYKLVSDSVTRIKFENGKLKIIPQRHPYSEVYMKMSRRKWETLKQLPNFSIPEIEEIGEDLLPMHPDDLLLKVRTYEEEIPLESHILFLIKPQVNLSLPLNNCELYPLESPQTILRKCYKEISSLEVLNLSNASDLELKLTRYDKGSTLDSKIEQLANLILVGYMLEGQPVLIPAAERLDCRKVLEDTAVLQSRGTKFLRRIIGALETIPNTDREIIERLKEILNSLK